MSDTTNAGPVLPLPQIDFNNLVPSTLAYGRQCWNACDEQVAGPLRERIKDLEDTLTNTRAERDTARGNWAFEQKRVAELERERDDDRRREYGYSQQTVDAISQERDRLRAENEALRAAIGRAIDRARVFDDGSDGADAESAQSCIAILEAARAAREG